MIDALGDRNEKGEDPPFICLKSSYFEWRKVRLPADREDSGPMTLFYEQSKNEGEFCNLEGGELEVNKTLVSKFTIAPSKIAADTLEIECTPLEVYDALGLGRF